ncbi:MAG: hypothetical protein ACE5JU_23235 [Candidatus Binatia bacterium]
MLLRRVLVSFLFLFLLMACSHQKPPKPHMFYVNEIELQQKWLPFLEDGIRKEVVESRLGRPLLRYEDGRIWTYTMHLEEGLLEPAPWGPYSLVLVFDEIDILKKHSLLRFRR